MANKYTVVRTDLMDGMTQPARIGSCRVYDGSDNPIEIENGSIVELQEYEDGQREVRKAILATASSKLNNCALIASPEIFYDDTKTNNLDEYINEANYICRFYGLHSNNYFSITAEGFKDGTVPTTIGAEVGIADGKVDASGSGFAVLARIESTKRYTYYVLRVLPTEA